MTPSDSQLEAIRRELARQEQELARIAGSLDPDQAESIVRLSDEVLERLDTAVGNLSRVRRPAVPFFGVRA